MYLSVSKRFHFLGIPGREFFKFDHGESLKKFIIVDVVGLEPTIQKTHGLSTTPFVIGISGVLVRLTTYLQRVDQ